MFAKILVPLDGSKLAGQAVPYAAEIARAFNSQVILLGVTEPDSTNELQQAVSAGAEHLTKLLGGTSASVNTCLLSGNPARRILECTVSEKVDFIIMTGYGRSGIGPWPLGGTIHKVLHLKSPVPILVIRPYAGDELSPGLLNRIVVPLDGSAHSESPLPYVVEIAKHFAMDVFLIRSIETEALFHGGFSGQFKIQFEQKDVENARKNAEAYLVDVSSRFSGTRAVVKTAVLTGEAAAEIIKYTDTLGYCLIAMGSHGHSGLDAWMYGSVTQKIINAKNKSLLIVRSLES
jgi:nucleotide-binding universal stress UspA family protein